MKFLVWKLECTTWAQRQGQAGPDFLVFKSNNPHSHSQSQSQPQHEHAAAGSQIEPAALVFPLNCTLMAPARILLCGDVLGRLNQLYKRVQSVSFSVYLLLHFAPKRH